MQSFQLDRKSGKKCYMLAARSLHISWGEDDRYWIWTTMPDSRLAMSPPPLIYSFLLVSPPSPLFVLTLFFILSRRIVHSISLDISYLSLYC